MEKFKFVKELIKVLYEIRNAIKGNNNEGEGNSDNEQNYTWYDFIKNNCVDPVTPYLEGLDDNRNPIPIGIYCPDYDENIHFLKDININENILEKYGDFSNLGRGIALEIVYEEPPRLYVSGSSISGSVSRIRGDVYSDIFAFNYIDSEDYKIQEKEYNGKTYYYALD